MISSQAFAPYDMEAVDLEEFGFDNGELEESGAFEPHYRAEDIDEALCNQQFGKVKKLFANCMKRGEIFLLKYLYRNIPIV